MHIVAPIPKRTEIDRESIFFLFLFVCSELPSFQEGRERGPMRGLGTDHVISGPMKGIKKKTASDGANRQTDGHGHSMTESAQWGQCSENLGGFNCKSTLS